VTEQAGLEASHPQLSSACGSNHGTLGIQKQYLAETLSICTTSFISSTAVRGDTDRPSCMIAFLFLDPEKGVANDRALFICQVEYAKVIGALAKACRAIPEIGDPPLTRYVKPEQFPCKGFASKHDSIVCCFFKST
jgi:hypothetical protein